MEDCIKDYGFVILLMIEIMTFFSITTGLYSADYVVAMCVVGIVSVIIVGITVWVWRGNHLDANKSIEAEPTKTAIKIPTETTKRVDIASDILWNIKQCRTHLHKYKGALESEMIQIRQQLKDIRKVLQFLFDYYKNEPKREEKLQKLYRYYLPTLSYLIEATYDAENGTLSDIPSLIQGYSDILQVLDSYKQQVVNEEDLALYVEVNALKTKAAYDGLTGGDKEKIIATTMESILQDTSFR